MESCLKKITGPCLTLLLVNRQRKRKTFHGTGFEGPKTTVGKYNPAENFRSECIHYPLRVGTMAKSGLVEPEEEYMENLGISPPGARTHAQLAIIQMPHCLPTDKNAVKPAVNSSFIACINCDINSYRQAQVVERCGNQKRRSQLR